MDEDFLGRCLVSAAGLTPQARGRLLLKDTFRTGGPRIGRWVKPEEDRKADMLTRHVPFPLPEGPRMPQPTQVQPMGQEQEDGQQR